VLIAPITFLLADTREAETERALRRAEASADIARTVLVPLLFRGGPAARWSRSTAKRGGDFGEEDLRLQATAATAAIAVGTAQSVKAGRLQQQVEVAIFSLSKG
jgi:hypothetical protein